MLARLAAAAVGLAFSPRGANAHGNLVSAPRWNERFEAAIDVTIAQAGGGRGRRPYVAIWIETPAGESLRTLSLWVQRTGRGSRWIPDLRRWYRNDRTRQASGGTDLIAIASSATRSAGKYTVTWDGRSDAGTLVEQGQYFVCVESAREHGTYQLIRQDFSFGSRAFQNELPGNPEIAAVTIRYRERA